MITYWPIKPHRLVVKKTPNSMSVKKDLWWYTWWGRNQNPMTHFFFKEIGVPVSLVLDGHMDQNNNNTNKLCHQVGTTLRILEAGTLWANQAELYIRIFKEYVRRDLRMTNTPMVLWDYCMDRWSRIHNAVPHPLFQNQEMTPHEATFGKQGDISNICKFGLYQWVYYRTPNSSRS